MVSMSIDSMPFVNEKIYRVVGYIRTKINGTEEALYTKNISMDLCSNVFDETYKYYDSIKDLNLSNFYCISLDKTKKWYWKRWNIFKWILGKRWFSNVTNKNI